MNAAVNPTTYAFVGSTEITSDGSSKGLTEKLHKEKLHVLYSLPNMIKSNQMKKDEMSETCGTYGRKEKCKEGLGR
jgi:hypothetical protein